MSSSNKNSINNDTCSSSSISAQIKGGGRAPLSEEAEEALVSLLMKLRSCEATTTKNNNNKKTTLSSSKHSRKHEHKRFVKRLVERCERQKLDEKVNQVDGDKDCDPLDDNKSSSRRERILLLQARLLEDGHDVQEGREKVRIELVEALFSNKSKKSLSTKQKGSSSSSPAKSKCCSDFKEGTRKVMVFERSTTIDDVQKQAKTKLRMKTKPIRCFLVEKKMEIDLVHNLRGLPDGAVVYVTCQERELDSDNDQRNAEKEIVSVEMEDEVPDPVQALKQAYIEREQWMRMNHHPYQSRRSVYAEHPPFSSYFDKLPRLSPERAQLPAAACRETVLEAVEQSRVTIISGATGCGKSTQVPQYILEGMIASNSGHMAQILVTQPRRVAAMSLAQRVAFEQQSPEPGKKGSVVGYHVRLDRSVSDMAKIVYCTVGILLRMLTCPTEGESALEDSEAKAIPLAHYSHVIIDEVHERDLNTDFSLTLIWSILAVNKHIRIILMSATAAADLFVRYFEGQMARIIDIPGRSFPVDINWLEDCQRFAQSTMLQGCWLKGMAAEEGKDDFSSPLLSPRVSGNVDNDFICSLIRKIVEQQVDDAESSVKAQTMGAVLVFLPGKAEIESLARTIRNDHYLGHGKLCQIFRLHSTIPRGEQQAIFKPAKAGFVKVLLATNIAETSITIPDVKHVIDTGRVKESRFNASTRIKELVTVWTSQASAQQRAGRAGRVSAGVCWRLYTESFLIESMVKQTSPEIMRTPLDELVLQVCLFHEQQKHESVEDTSASFVGGISPGAFLSSAPEPPSNESISNAYEHLLEVGAIKVVSIDPVLYRLTPLGYHLSRLPMDAKVGKVLIVGCLLECVDPALTIAATLSCTKSCFLSRWGGSKDDDWQVAVDARAQLIESGFGGKSWKGGTVKGDSIAAIAAYSEWSKKKNDKERAIFCKLNALDNVALREIHQLRSQFHECLIDAGFLSHDTDYNKSKDDALLTSCCVVAGFYPNVATLLRPQRGKTGFKGGQLLTKDGDVCRPSSSSFQAARVARASEAGKDAYVMYHSKHRSVGASTSIVARNVFLQEVNFVSRFALLLFGGELEIRNNAVIVDRWLKFKVGDKGLSGAVLIRELRKELDNVLLRHILNSTHSRSESKKHFYDESQEVLDVVRKLLSAE